MKVKDLIEQLSKFDPELDVRVFADCGQTDMKITSVHKYCSESDEWMIESSFDYVTDYYEEYGEDAPPPYEFVSLYAG